MSLRTLEGGWHPLKTLFCLPTVKLHLEGFVTYWNYSEQFFFSERFSLEYLVTHVLTISCNAHDALEDSKV